MLIDTIDQIYFPKALLSMLDSLQHKLPNLIDFMKDNNLKRQGSQGRILLSSSSLKKGWDLLFSASKSKRTIGLIHTCVHIHILNGTCVCLVLIICFFIHLHAALIVVSVKNLYQLKGIISAFTYRIFSTARAII